MLTRTISRMLTVTLVATVSPLLLAAPTADAPRFDLTKDKVLYCVGYAHLDTQWRWDFCTTIDRFVRDTLEQNFARFEKYPGYVFNFTGTVRYEMMSEYYPDLYEQLKRHIREGRWYVSGSSVDEGDVNVPSPESIIRHVLYGNQFFRREFGKESVDFMLPDCFGFPASMPSIWAHCGLLGFSTQKLTWGSAVGIPFKIGVWEGPDGRSVLAALDPGPYVGAIKGPVHTNPTWTKRIDENGEKYGVWADYHYYGVGDTGGAPHEEDVANYLASAKLEDAPIRVALVSSDQMFKDITPEMKARLPRYKGDLLLTEHSAGTLTSQSYMKRWNRKNEQLADAAERAATAAHWLGGVEYPREKLYRSWVRALANQMHDILPGTSIPRAYTFSWNDELVGMNGFAEVLTDGVGGVVRAMDTRAEGRPLIVFNPLARRREDPVEATVRFDGNAPATVRVFDARGRETPSQILKRDGAALTILFIADVPPVGFGVFDVRPAESAFSDAGGLNISPGSIENEHYRVTINEAGDVASIVDKKAGGRELLAAPHQLVFTYERPANWPAWNMDWKDRQKPPIDVLRGPVKVRIVERGPVRVSLEIHRGGRNSFVTQQIRLTRGDAGRRVEFKTDIDWQSTECALKASFPLSVSNPMATYNWGMGTIDRGNNEPTKYEVPSHEWLDLTDAGSEYGVSILEDSKYGSDKPSDNTVRLTLLYTPGVRLGYLDQHSQDWGRHEMIYAVYGHAGDWRQGRTEWQGRRLNQPLRAFEAPAHAGPLGREWSLLNVNTEQVDVRAVKLAEDEDRIIVRLQELWGRSADAVEVSFAAPIADVYEVDGQERRISEAKVDGGKLTLKITPYSPRSFSLRLAAAPVKLERPRSTPVALPYDADVVSADRDFDDGAFDAEGRTIPAEMLPRRIVSEGIAFELGPTAPGRKNAVVCKGQTVPLPPGPHDAVYLLAAATRDTAGAFRVGDRTTSVSVQSWTGFIGQFDDRVWDRPFDELDFVCDGNVVGITAGFIKRDPIAWFCTHRHHPSHGNESYRFSYLFKYRLDLPPDATEMTLPDNELIRLLAVSVGRGDNDDVRSAAPLYDDFSDRGPVQLRHVYPPPPPPVFEGVTPVADAAIERREDFQFKLGEPVSTDYADSSAGHGVVFAVFDGDGEYSPHRGSGLVNGSLPRMNDGETARNDDDTQRCVWYDQAGRFYADLRGSVKIGRINTFSRHRTNRAPQYFSVWASNAEKMPDPGFKSATDSGWTLLAVVNTAELGSGGAHASSIRAKEGALGPYRWLLWITEDVGQGTFFTEIDIHAAE